MSVNSRRKGHAFERLIASELLTRLGITFRRDLDQYRTRDRGDLLADDPDFPFTMECKHCTRPEHAAWRKQATTAATAASKRPCVIWRITGGPIRVSVPLSAFCDAWPADDWADVSLDGFCLLAREIMAEPKAWRPNDYRDLRDRIVGAVERGDSDNLRPFRSIGDAAADVVAGYVSKQRAAE